MRPPSLPAMKRFARHALVGLWFGLSLVSMSAQAYWTGVGDGWLGQTPPPNDGTADLVYLQSIGQTIPLDGITDVNSLTFVNDDDYILTAASPSTLTVAGGIFASSSISGNRIKFDQNITLNLSGAGAVFDAEYSNVIISGKITGTAPLLLTFNADNNGSGGFVFNNAAAADNYSGGTTITSLGSAGAGSVAFWNSTPFGTGPVTITNGAYFAAHNALTLVNNFSVISNASDPWSMRIWDAPLTLSGTITLAANNDVISSRFAFTALPASNNEGSLVFPGPLTRLPTIFTGNIIEGGPNYGLTVGGTGVTIFNFTPDSNTYKGGTTVNGSLVFGSNSSIPPAGLVTVASTYGYVGTADVASSHFAAFLSRISPSSSGSVGVDSLPGTGTSTLNDGIDLTAFTTGTGIRLGTATSAILTGTITPQKTNGNTSQDYHFGNGGGSLYVQSLSLIHI